MMDWVFISFLEKPLWIWIIFMAIIAFLLILDLGVLHRRQHIITIRESLKLSLFYIIMGILFGLWIWFYLGEKSAEEYFTGYLVEKSLSLDNIFVISLIFSHFHIPRQFQHRVLFWGILGVIVLRGLMIGLGSLLIHQFEWITYIFSLFLILTGIKMLLITEQEPDFGNHFLIKFLGKHVRLTPTLHDHRFTVRLENPLNSNKKNWYITPLLLALILVEIADIIFAIDSVPAIFSITRDPYIVYTSNIFAILGLRSLYFALSAIVDRFTYLKYSLALILIFIGGKVWAVWLMGIEEIPALISLSVTIALLTGGILVSVTKSSSTK